MSEDINSNFTMNMRWYWSVTLSWLGLILILKISLISSITTDMLIKWAYDKQCLCLWFFLITSKYLFFELSSVKPFSKRFDILYVWMVFCFSISNILILKTLKTLSQKNIVRLIWSSLVVNFVKKHFFPKICRRLSVSLQLNKHVSVKSQQEKLLKKSVEYLQS